MDLTGGGGDGAAAPAAAGAGGGSEDEDDDDADLRAVAAAMREGNLDSYHRRQQQQLLAHYQAQAAGQLFGGGGDLQQQQPAGAGEGGEGPGGAAAAAGVRDEPPLDLPDGINVEEARMLEAAMLGVPYAGRIPDFTAAAAAAPLSPGAMEQRSLRQEQDAAYEESLALDRCVCDCVCVRVTGKGCCAHTAYQCNRLRWLWLAGQQLVPLTWLLLLLLRCTTGRAKQQSMAAAAAEVEAARRAEQEAQTAEEVRAAAAAAALQALLATKAQRLPREAPDGEGGSLAIVVRLPSGQRKGRRFRPSDALQAVFDFVDVECCSSNTAGAGADAAAGGGSAGGCEHPSGITPGSYRLVSQFPRKVFVEDGSSSLQDAGITSDCALFIEPL
jgi:hypothetical protein